MKNKITQNIKAIVLAIILTMGVGYVSAQVWTEPTLSPPNGNVAAPINVGDSAQTKTGALTSMHLFTPDFTFIPSTAPIAGQVMVAADATGKVKWANVAPTTSVNCSNVSGTSYISLNGNNSGNNNSTLINLGTLSAGTYTFNGSGSTYDSGGAGFAGVVLTNSPDSSKESVYSSLVAGYEGTPVTSDTGSSYTTYYNDSSHPNTIVIKKRNGYDDGAFTMPSKSLTITGTKYMYLYLGQAAISGSLTITGSQSVCPAGSSAASSATREDSLFYYDSGKGYTPPPTIFEMTPFSTKIPASAISQSGFVRGSDFSLSGKSKVGVVASGHGGSRPYIILKTNKRAISIETTYIRWDSSMNPVLIVDINAGTVTLGYEGGAGIFYKNITLDSGEIPLSIRAAGVVYDDAGGGDLTRLIYNQ